MLRTPGRSYGTRGTPGTRSLPAFAVGAVLVALAIALPPSVGLWRGGDRPAAAEGAGGTCRVPASAPGTAAAGRELRGMTITTISNLDWPSRPGLDEQTVKAEYRGWLDLAQRMNMNAVFVHIRPSGDAFWPSAYAPWSQWLTGRRDGSGPDWDPLAFMVEETHARNIEFHAWFNPYKADQAAPEGAGPDIAALPPNHPLRQRPQWAVAYPVGTSSSKLYFNPGIPEARRFVEDSMLDAVARYDLDGVFFDDFFYPYPAAGQDFNDAATFAAYGKGFASKADWRRDNVNRLVQEMGQRIKALKPWVKFGISPFGIWRNRATDARGSATQGLESYDQIYVDTRLWVKNEWVDFIMPQLYWHIGNPKADYAKLVPWWSQLVAGTRVQLYTAHADYRIGEAGAWRDPAQLDRQLALNGRYSVSGTVHFSAVHVRADKLGAVTRYRDAHYARPALVPTITGLPSHPPPAPILTGVRRDDAGQATVTWRAGAGSRAARFAVYRAEPGATAATLVGTAPLVGDGQGAREATQTFVDASAASGQRYTYCVTALDRLWNEGPASHPRTTSPRA